MINKLTIRELYLNRRLSLNSDYMANATKDIIKQIKANPKYIKAKKIGIYYPISNEVDLLSLLNDHKEFYFPVINKDNKLAFLLYTKEGFTNDKYGIKIPKSNIFADQLDLIIVPGIAFNSEGYRIGYGKGFYDKYLASLKNRVVTIGVCYIQQLINFNHELHDYQLDEIIFNQNKKNNLVVLAAGSSTRAGENKILAKKNGYYLFEHSLNKFSDDFFKYVVINEANAKELIRNDEFIYLLGGPSRTQSLANTIPYLANNNYTFIHDGARPYLSIDDLKKLEGELKFNYDALSLIRPQTDAITYNGEYLDKTKIINYETPQVIKTSLLNTLDFNKDYPDDISNLVANNEKIDLKLVTADDINYKITTKAELDYFLGKYRIGHSFDLHKITFNKPLILGGLKFSDNNGLEAISDGDCILHALSEAILGALNQGDLGLHFKEKDPNNLGLDSKKILSFAIEKLKLADYSIINIDIMLYYELVRLNKHYEEIRINLGNLLGINKELISIKATTSEKLGPVGDGKAMGCEAVVLIGAK